MSFSNEISWIILAGGKASRMDGNDKGLIRFKGKCLVEHVFEKLSPQAKNIFISANRNHTFYANYAPVISDEVTGFPGPLAGFHSGLAASNSEWVGFVPCDSPFLVENYVEKMSAAIHDQTDIIVAHDGSYPQPVFALINQRLLPDIEAFLQRGDRKIKLFLSQSRTQYVDFSTQTECFINLNTPDELSHLEKNR